MPATRSKAQLEHEINQLESRLLVAGIRERYGYALDAYGPESLTSFFRQAIKKEGLKTFAEYQTKLLRDESVLQSLLSLLCLEDGTGESPPLLFSKGFRKWVLPLLKTYPSLRLWHLGCAETPLTQEMVLNLKRSKLIDRSHIYATEMGQQAVELAKGKRKKLGSLKDKVSYFQHCFLNDGSFNTFHVVASSANLSKLTLEAREKVLGLIFDSVVPLGFYYHSEKGILAGTSFSNLYRPLGAGWYQKRV